MAIVLTINGGSSSIRFAFYDAANASTKLLDGKIDRIGLSGASMSVEELAERRKIAATNMAIDAADQRSAAAFLIDWLESHPLFAKSARSVTASCTA